MTETSARSRDELHASLLRVERAVDAMHPSMWLCVIAGLALVAFALLQASVSP